MFYLLYGNMQVAFAFLLSCFFTSTRTANVATWIWVLGSGLFAGNLLDSVFAAGKWWSTLVQFIPTAGAYRWVTCSAQTHPTSPLHEGVACCGNVVQLLSLFKHSGIYYDNPCEYSQQ